MPLELVKTSAGTMLMGQESMGLDPAKGADDVLKTFKQNYERLGRRLARQPLNLSVKSKKGLIASFVERAPHGRNEVLTPSTKRILLAGQLIMQTLARGKKSKKLAGAAAVWLTLAKNYRTFLVNYPALLVAGSKAVLQEAKIASPAASLRA